MVKVLKSTQSQIRCHDCLITINGQPVEDQLDLQYHSSSAGRLEMTLSRNGRLRRVTIASMPSGRTLPIQVEAPAYRTCVNRCSYCFVDQLPPGLRPELYFKDDDYRLSFLFGNFISLTNFTEPDLARIKRLHLSPLYVSVHATDPVLRRRLFGNPRAAEITSWLRRLGEADIKIHAQVVLIPRLNDGLFLDRTINDLAGLYPAVASVGIVPVGQTRHRRPPLPTLGRAGAKRLINRVRRWQNRFRKEYGLGFVYLADEIYFKAGEPIPVRHDYDDLPQLGNGIGMARTFLEEVTRLRPLRSTKGRFLFITGALAHPLIAALARRLNPDRIAVRAVGNRFLGPSITVSGLLAGQDIRKGLDPRYDRICLPPNCTNDQGRLLDDLTIEDLNGRRIMVAPESLQELRRCLA